MEIEFSASHFFKVIYLHSAIISSIGSSNGRVLQVSYKWYVCTHCKCLRVADITSKGFKFSNISILANSFSDLHLEVALSMAFLILSLVSSNLDPF